MLTVKHSKEALAFWKLFNAMRPEIKNEVRDMVMADITTNDDLTTDMMTNVSMNSFAEVWDAPQNDHWDDFIKTRLECTNKEI